MTQYFVHSEAGYEHNNQDTAAVRPHPMDPSVLLCALADGQGGSFGGAEASQIAVDNCLAVAAAYPVLELMTPETWFPILSSADGAVCDAPEAGLTTLIGLCLAGGDLCGAFCGDSAAQLIVGSRSLLLTENQHKNPPVGSGEARPVAFNTVLPVHWTLLLMSDGVWRYVEHDAIAALAESIHGQALVDALRQKQLGLNGNQLPDDFSIILLQEG